MAHKFKKPANLYGNQGIQALYLPLINTECGFNFRSNLESWLSRFRLPYGAFIGILAESSEGMGKKGIK